MHAHTSVNMAILIDISIFEDAYSHITIYTICINGECRQNIGLYYYFAICMPL